MGRKKKETTQEVSYADVTLNNFSEEEELPVPKPRREKDKAKEKVDSSKTNTQIDEELSRAKAAADNMGWFKKFFYLLKAKKKRVKVFMFNKNNTITKYGVVPLRNQFNVGNDRYIWDSSVAAWDHKEKAFTSVYYEGVPLPVTLFSADGKLTFDTVDSDTYTQVQKMEYIKTLAQSGQISKILKNVFLICVINLFGLIALVALVVTQTNILGG